MSMRVLCVKAGRYSVAALAMFAILAWPSVGDACTVTSIPTPAELTERAALILHVRARGYCTDSGDACRQLRGSPAANPAQRSDGPGSYSSVGIAADGLIAFEVLARLKGQNVPPAFTIPGKLVERDDFNDHAPPYTFVRRGGRSGNCFAYGYRQGAEYLLFLQPQGDVMTPYWAALAPVNEQVRSAQDPWIDWVRGQLEAR
jgi:hypothetical protein